MADEAGTTVGANDPATPDTVAAATPVTPPESSAEGENGSTPETQPDPFADLDADTREWLGKREVKSLSDAAKLAHEQSKLLGNAIRVPGEKATEEERNAFLNKLGRPETADGYEFTVPDSLPENLPYDAERAEGFKSLAHEIGLTAKQAAAVHDWAAKNAVDDFTGLSEAQHARLAERAKGETEKLVKRWGPLDSETTRANLELADRALKWAGGEELVDELKELGLIGPNKEILSDKLAVTFANIGGSLFREGDLVKGDPSTIGNPFEDGEHFNLTKAMAAAKADPEHAKSLIRAAGKRPADFGLRD